MCNRPFDYFGKLPETVSADAKKRGGMTFLLMITIKLVATSLYNVEARGLKGLTSIRKVRKLTCCLQKTYIAK